MGSMLALILYPIAVEPWLPLRGQAWLFTVGSCILVALVWGCFGYLMKVPGATLAHPGGATSPTPAQAPATTSPPVAAESIGMTATPPAATPPALAPAPVPEAAKA